MKLKRIEITHLSMNAIKCTHTHTRTHNVLHILAIHAMEQRKSTVRKSTFILVRGDDLDRSVESAIAGGCQARDIGRWKEVAGNLDDQGQRRCN